MEEREKAWPLHFAKKNVQWRKHRCPNMRYMCLALPCFVQNARVSQSTFFHQKYTQSEYIWTPRSIHKPSPIFHRQKVPPFQPSHPIRPKFSTHSSATFLCAFPPSFLPFTLLCSMFMLFRQFAASSVLRTVRSLSLIVNIRTKSKYMAITSCPIVFFHLSFACHNSSQASLAQGEGSSRIGRSREATELCSDESGAAEQRRWRVVKSRRPKNASCVMKNHGRSPDLPMISHDLALCSQTFHYCTAKSKLPLM